jgi:hypothetical protein
MPAKQKRAITDEVVKRAIEIREQGGSWKDVIEATGFNGAALRPHMARAGYQTAQKVVTVKLNAKSIVAARKAGMSWYALALALDTSEAKLRALASEADKTVATGRTYLKADKPAPKPATKAKAPAKTPAKAKPAPRAKARS